MTTFKEAFGSKYNEARQTGDAEGFRDFVKSQVSNTNIAKALGVSPSSVTSRMKNPIAIMKLVVDNADVEINLSTERNTRKVTIEDLPTEL